jgi:diguanylate cyclase (GGDEF)-like protein/PAS domain S-box-containing protein
MENFYKELLHSLNVGIYFVDRQRRITFWNKGAEMISGFTEEEVLGRSCADGILMHVNEKGEILCQTGCPLHGTILDGQRREMIVYMKHANGHRVPVEVSSNPIRNGNNEIIGAAEVFTDISLRMNERQKVRELEKEINIDPLTGLANRRYANISLERILFEWQRHKIPFGLIFIDVDNFKLINDKYGHAAGDEALRVIAACLESGMRAGDIVARWAGDEFLVIIQNIDIENLRAIAQKLLMLVAASDFKFKNEILRVTISGGAALAKEGDTIDTIIMRADQSMYENKQSRS